MSPREDVMIGRRTGMSAEKDGMIGRRIDMSAGQGRMSALRDSMINAGNMHRLRLLFGKIKFVVLLQTREKRLEANQKRPAPHVSLAAPHQSAFPPRQKRPAPHIPPFTAKISIQKPRKAELPG